jgi:hypothetical protein
MKEPVKVEMDIVQIMEQLGISPEHFIGLGELKPAAPSGNEKHEATSSNARHG